MTKFVISKEVPEKLSSYELRIDPPTLLQEVKNCWGYRPANGHTGINWLRQIAGEICKWDPKFHPYRHTIPNDYMGIPFSTPEDVALIVSRMVADRYPGLCDAWVEHCIRHKPPFTKLIWFTGDFKQTSSFSSNFIDRIELSEVDAWMGRHKKQVKNEEQVAKTYEAEPIDLTRPTPTKEEFLKGKKKESKVVPAITEKEPAATAHLDTFKSTDVSEDM